MKTIVFKIWNDYSKSLTRCVRTIYPKTKYKIVGKYKGKKETTYYLMKK